MTLIPVVDWIGQWQLGQSRDRLINRPQRFCVKTRVLTSVGDQLVELMNSFHGVFSFNKSAVNAVSR